jgi:hypothetical protein
LKTHELLRAAFQPKALWRLLTVWLGRWQGGGRSFGGTLVTGALGEGEGKGPLAGEGLEEVLTIEAAMLVA